jgi:hypothetical protein
MVEAVAMAVEVVLEDLVVMQVEDRLVFMLINPEPEVVREF